MERREGRVVSIGEVIERNIILKGADVLTQKGFTMVPNHLLVSNRISPGAKLAYAMLLKCFPGQETLAREMGVTRQSVNTYLEELQHQKFIEIKRRGQGLTNLYVLFLKATGKTRRRSDVKNLDI
jgi:biotin operon repressor